MPAAAVIPAPIAYINVAAVKKLVVGFLTLSRWPGDLALLCCRRALVIFSEELACPLLGWVSDSDLLL